MAPEPNRSRTMPPDSRGNHRGANQKISTIWFSSRGPLISRRLNRGLRLAGHLRTRDDVLLDHGLARPDVQEQSLLAGRGRQQHRADEGEFLGRAVGQDVADDDVAGGRVAEGVGLHAGQTAGPA